MTQSENVDLLATAIKWHVEGNKVAVGTVIRTWKSAPRPLGARLIINQDGRFAGSVSGGCVEKEVIHAAADCLQHNTVRHLSFGIGDQMAWQSGLSCGGQIDVFVAPLPAPGTSGHQALEEWRQAVVQRNNGILITNINNGELTFKKINDVPPSPIFDDNHNHFLEPCIPQRRLLIVGATHIAQTLAPLARQCDFDVIIIDPRQAWLTAARFPDTVLDERWPEDALPDIGVDEQTAVVTLAHDPKIDDGALTIALSKKAHYIGALGSVRTHEKRRKRLLAEGISAESFAHIHAPVGLDINAKSAAEIAVAIISEVLSTYSKK